MAATVSSGPSLANRRIHEMPGSLDYDPAVRGERGRIWLPGDDDLSVSVVDRCVHDHLLEYHCKL